MAESENIPKTPEHDPEEVPVSDEELAEMDRPLHELLGIERPYAPEHLAPPVDFERLMAFVRDELFGDDLRDIVGLIASYESWNDALADALREHAILHPHDE